MKSFRTRILVTITATIFTSMIITISFIGYSLMNELTHTLENNAQNLIESMELNIES